MAWHDQPTPLVLVLYINPSPCLLDEQELALQLAGRLGLPGCDHLFLQQFQTLMAAGDVQGM